MIGDFVNGFQAAEMKQLKLRTTAEREQAGKFLRQKCPRLSHGKVVLGQGKRNIVSLIEASNRGRLENLVPIRYGRMLQSPFAYFRGTALIQAHDLAGTPASGINVHACGDCHLMNFGGFATPERNIVFDINDFDETLPAPFEWDIKRLAASFVIAARWRGFRSREAREIAIQAVAAYRESMRKRAGTSVLEAWYSRITADDVVEMAGDDGDLTVRLKKKIAEARKQTHEHVFHRHTAPSKRRLPRIVDQPPLLYHLDIPQLGERAVTAFFKRYRETLAEERRMLFDRFKVADVAVKVVGVGSVGTRCLVVLFSPPPTIRCFCSSRRPALRYSNAIPGIGPCRTTASASWSDSV
jgi:uncharacterized protein (DUF2252 family)